MNNYPYDPDLPYVLVNTLTGNTMGRATSRPIAENFSENFSAGLAVKIIDTTPKPRVPDDAKFITYQGRTGLRFYARRALNGLWIDHDDDLAGEDVQSLPCVTPDTVFTVLDAREERKNDD